MMLHRAARPDADQGLRTILCNQFIGIDRQGWHAHARSVDRDGVAFVGACKAKHPAHFVYQTCIGQEIFRSPFCTAWITGHQDCFGDIAFFCVDMWGHGLTYCIL